MARITPAGGLTGIAPLDERVSADTLTADSSYSQAGPRPGSQIPADPKSQLVVRASGSQAADLTVQALAAGMPGAVRVGYYPTADGAGLLRGWQPPNLITAWFPLQWSDTVTYARCHDVTVIPSTQAVVSLYFKSSSPYQVYAHRCSPYATEPASAVALPEASSTTASRVGGICCLPDERLLAVVGDDAGWTAYYSDDSGDTWEVAANNVLDVDPGLGTPTRGRLFCLPSGDVLLVLVDSSAKIVQYASSDLGCSFRQVEEFSSPAFTGGDVVALLNGKIGVFVIDSGTGQPVWRVVGSAWDPFSGAATSELVPAVDEVCVWAEPPGRLYAAVLLTSGKTWDLYQSEDDGTTWSPYNWGGPDMGDSSTYPRYLSAVAAGGSSWWIHQWAASPGNEGASIGLMRLGGWSSLTGADWANPATERGDVRRVGTGSAPSGSAVASAQWLPFDEPGDIAFWGASGLGTDTLASGALQVTTVANTRLYVLASTPGTPPGNILAFAELLVASGGSQTTADIAFRVQLDAGASDAAVALYFNNTGFKVHDLAAGTVLATVAIDLALYWQFAVGIDENRYAIVLYRRPGSAAWAVAWEGTLTAGTYATNLQWGHLASASASSWWRSVQVLYGAAGRGWETAGATSTGHDRPGGRVLNGVPFPLGDDGDAAATFLAAGDGPARVAETVSIPAAYDYGVERLFPLASPSPANEWRSTEDGEQILEFLPGSLGAGVETALGYSRSVVIGFLGANFRTAYLEAWDGASWVELGEYDGAIDFDGLTAAVAGDQVSPDAGTATAGRYLQRAELVGGVAILGTGKSEDAAYILHQEEGLWADADTRQPRLTVDRPVSAGACVLVSPAGILVCHGVGEYEKFRIRIPDQITPDGYFRLGNLFIGGLVLTGLPWDWGWQRELRPTITESVDRAGVSRRRQDGEPRRIWSVAWPAGVPLARLRSGTPDYLSPDASLDPLGAVRDVPWLLEGAWREALSGERPSIAIAQVPLTATYATLTDPTLWVYGRLTGSVQQSHMAGRWGREAVRVETISIEEIPGRAPIPPYEA